MLRKGDLAPNFDAKDEHGNPVRLSDFIGKRDIVLVFYPADDTSICTAQLCAIRDDWSKFQQKGLAVFGISNGKDEKKRGFAAKHSFQFPLVSDPDRHIAAAYGVKGWFFVKRAVFAIGRDGKIRYAKSGKPDDADILAAF